jgi:phosphoribosylaminoimidazolecarboxamide formyltransferase/IMP cyclohydrolase
VAQIKTALVSVADKGGLEDFAAALRERGIKIIASGGTGQYLKEKGIETVEVAGITGRVETLGGLVKTLHPGIHAGILADRADSAHMRELSQLGYEKIDMVVVNFYPLGDASAQRDLSFIDIGGPAMARAAAKNFASCVPVPHPSWYPRVAEAVGQDGDVDADLRWALARDTLERTGTYDATTLSLVPGGTARENLPELVLLGLARKIDLRYGENPHQGGGFYTAGADPGFKVLKGDLSYNNILDIDCCIAQLAEFERDAAVVVKHVGPCGVAELDSGLRSLEKAYACDPLSAFGGVIGVNFTFDGECAAFVAKKFVECVVAPAFDGAALERLRKKKRTRLVEFDSRPGPERLMRTAAGGLLVQQVDRTLFTQDLKFVAGPEPDGRVMEDLVFAWKAVKHVKSNAIVFAGAGATLGIGAGQPSRVDSVRIAIRKAREGGHDLHGSVMASDGFFPFPDSIELAADAGARAVIQPGGSIRDQEVIDRAGELGVAMALTFTRHFRH